MRKDKLENNKSIEIRKGKVVGSEISKSIGVTLIFYTNEGELIQGVLKSLIITTSLDNFDQEVINHSKIISKKFGLKYLGINDVFIVEDSFRDDTIVGRISDYHNEFKSIELELNDKNFNEEEEYYKLAINYKCSDRYLDVFVIEIILILLLSKENYKKKISSLSENRIKDRIKKISLDGLEKIDFVGIKEINVIDSCDTEDSVFETLYSVVESVDKLKKSVVSIKELKLILNDIYL